MKYVITFILLFVFGVFVKAALFLMLPYGSSAEEGVFWVRPGDSFNRVAQKLEEQDYISSALELKILAKVLGKTTSLKQGEYRMKGGMRPLSILNLLSSGRSIEYSVTIPEGYNIYEVAEIFSSQGFFNKQEFIKKCQDSIFIEGLLNQKLESLEGYLFPDTYLISKLDSMEKVIKMMVRHHLESAKGLFHPDLTDHEIVILASIIEKETGAPEERPLISSVFHNRLKKAMRLQTDPTVLYGILDQTHEMKKNITKKDLTKWTRYNTYTFKGLPFGPIANPGKEALVAAVKPEKTDYLYFVSRNDGTHVFSETYNQHLKAVQKFQLDRKAREGKSWRDLNKRSKGASL